MINDISILAEDFLKTMEKDEAFFEAKKQGGFVKSFKAENVMEFLDEAWDII